LTWINRAISIARIVTARQLEEEQMSASIGFWRAEHAGFAHLLDLLEKKLVAFHTGERPDYDLMLDILLYLRHFPDRYHHPREDIAFDCLVKRDAGLAALVEHLKEEHRLIAAAGDSLHQLLAEASEGAIVSREKIDSAAQAYLVDYRRHIASEELTVMPRALALLTAEDWALVAHAAPAAIDPLFGEEADNSYRELRRLIAIEAG
jgi:hemerythrin-like domain-containing protein